MVKGHGFASSTSTPEPKTRNPTPETRNPTPDTPNQSHTHILLLKNQTAKQVSVVVKGHGFASKEEQQQRLVDEKEDMRRMVSEGVPKTFKALKNHPLYCLEKHLLKTQVNLFIYISICIC